MTCNCIENIDADLREHGLCLNVAHQVLTGEPPVAVVSLVRLDKYVMENRRGKPKEMVATFCPWCGVRYKAKMVGRASDG